MLNYGDGSPSIPTRMEILYHEWELECARYSNYIYFWVETNGKTFQEIDEAIDGTSHFDMQRREKEVVLHVET